MLQNEIHPFGAMLKRYRRELGVTQQALATRAGYSPVYVGMLERGERLPSTTTVKSLAEALALDERQRERLISAVHASNHASASNHHHASDYARNHLPDPSSLPPSGSYESRLVGRSQEMTLLRQHLTGDVGPTLLALVGEPGIGKTRLLQEIAWYASATGWIVLEGGSHALSGPEPFSPLLEALEGYMRSQTPALLQQQLEGCGWLAHLLPELAEGSVALPLPSAPGLLLSPEQKRRLMFQAVGRFLRHIARDRGTVLVLDDMQWASPDALDLLAYLVHATVETPLRIICALRSTEVRPEESLGVLLRDLTRAGEATLFELNPLARDAARELLEGLIGQPTRERAHVITQALRRAGGMPLFLVSYAQAHQAMNKPSWSALDAIPRDIVDGMRQRAAALSETARELLSAAAVIGRCAPRTLLMEVLLRQGWSEGAILTALEDTCRARLLVEEGYDAYRFSHDLAREAIIASLSTARRSTLHRRVAEAIEEMPTQPSVQMLAYHYSCSGDLKRAVGYLERAGDHALALSANVEASRAYHELAAQLVALDRTMEAAAAREKLGAALMSVAQYDSALDALEWAAEMYRSGDDLEGLVRVLARIGEVHALRGSSEDGLARLWSWLSVIGEGGDEDSADEISPRASSLSLAALYISLAWLTNTTGQYAEALQMALRAIDLASAARDEHLVLQAKLRSGHLLLMLEYVDQGTAILEEAIPVAEKLGNLRGLRFALNSLGWIEELRGNFAQDYMYTERAFYIAEQLEDPTVLAFMQSNRGSPAFNRGNWQQARTEFEAGLAMSRQVGASWAAAWPPLLLGKLCLVEGQQVRADELLQEAIALADRNHDLEAQRWAQAALAERDLLANAPASALERLRPLLDRPGQQEIDVCTLLPLLAQAYSALGQIEQAQATASTALARAKTAGLPPIIAESLQARAMIAQQQGRWGEAQADLEEALAIHRSLEHRYGEAKALYALGMFWLRQENNALAKHRLTQASDNLAQLGERLYAEQVNVALRRLDTRANSLTN